MRHAPSLLLGLATLLAASAASGWTPKPAVDDPLIRMPGTQPKDGVLLTGAGPCTMCHNPSDPEADLSRHWRGTMMGQAARDPLFWATLTVTLQDSIWALGNPNAGDLCLRCHTPKAWLGGRSDPANGMLVIQDDFDGVSCDACHRMVDPFHTATAAGAREGSDWQGYWDEASALSQDSAADTLALDDVYTEDLELWSAQKQYDAAHEPSQAGWTENGSGEYFMTNGSEKRGPYADALSAHVVSYSRYHKSKYYCETCHDVSNPVFANMGIASSTKGDLTTILPSEAQPPYAMVGVERTWSEFYLSDYGLPGGATGSGAYDPSVFRTSQPGNAIATCQDCHMADRNGRGCNKEGAVIRPGGSAEHPKSGHPTHDLTGGNAWIPWILASTVQGSPNYSATNDALLNQGGAVLTMRLDTGDGLHPDELIEASERAVETLRKSATLEQLSYTAASGALSLRIRNHTGHKLITGYPEGRRMFLNIRLYQGNTLLQEVNPYDDAVGTLKGLDPMTAPSSPPLGPGELHLGALVYETHPKSTLTGEEHTFHFVLADDRSKDNRIPPRGFRVAEAGARNSLPYDAGSPAPGLFTAAEYGGGWDDVSLALAPGATSVVATLAYQTTSREYVEFLRDEIKGTGTTLVSPTPSGEADAYVAQTDPYFAQLKAWGQVIWDLWVANKDIPGAAPIVMVQATQGAPPTGCEGPGTDGLPCDDHDLCTSGDTCQAGVCAGAAKVCAAVDGCHGAGACNPATGLCSSPPVADGAACSDKSACTDESCQGGTCVAATVVSCPPSPDECLADGTCNALTANCEFLPLPDGTACSLGTCQSGVCSPGQGGAGGMAGAGGMPGGQGGEGAVGGAGMGGAPGGSGGEGGGGSGGATTQGGGCGCSVPAPGAPLGWAALGLPLALALRRRRR